LTHQLGLHVGACLALGGIAEVGFVLPAILSQAAQSGAPPVPSLPRKVATMGLGDLLLTGKVQVWTYEGLSLAGSLQFGLPTGNQDAYMGWGFALYPRAIVEYAFASGTRLIGNVGASLRGKRELLNVDMGSAGTFAVGGEIPFRANRMNFSMFTTLSGEIAGSKEDSPLELALGAGWQATKELSVRLGGGTGLTSGYGTPVFRVWAGVTRTFVLPR
jgi:hypothetical protein